MPASLRSFVGSNRPPPSSYRAPPSPTLSTTTSASQLDLGDEGPKVIITRADLRDSVLAYEQLLSSAKSYRNALIALSSASTDLAASLEGCSRLKGSQNGESGKHLLAASGLHYMVANSGQVLSDTLYRSFEVPLMTSYDSYVSEIASRHSEYEQLLYDKTQKIRETEAENLKLGKKKARDLNQFRQALTKLTEQVAEVDVCKRSYYEEVLTSETEMWNQVDHKVSLLIRSTLDLSDRLASKATSDPTIEHMLEEHPDPFDSYRLEQDRLQDRELGGRREDVFNTVLPPINLGIGGGGGGGGGFGATRKKVEEERGKVEIGENGGDVSSSTTTTRRTTPTTVSEVLGLHEETDEEGDRDSLRPNAVQSDDKEDGKLPVEQGEKDKEEKEAQGAATRDIPPTVSSSSATTTDSSSIDNDLRQDPFEGGGTSLLTDESAPFVTTSTTSRPNALRTISNASSTLTTTSLDDDIRHGTTIDDKSSRNQKKRSSTIHGRRLSKVVESRSSNSDLQQQQIETDPMSGDWGIEGVYDGVHHHHGGASLALNGGGNGYESGEDDHGWRG